jgi:hypothetical protein
VIDVVLSSLNGIDWRSIDRYTIVSQRSKSMVHQNSTTIYGITNRVDSSTVIIDIISFSTLYIYISAMKIQIIQNAKNIRRAARKKA